MTAAGTRSARTAMAGMLVAALAGAALAVGGNGSAMGAKEPRPDPPNVVVVMSDDQAADSMRFMSRTEALLGERGATFANSFVNWPLCCPSRATFLTGQYAHNHQVLGNQPPLGGFDRLDSSETLPVWLQRAGYYTAHVGKYLNGYERSAVGVPPGWSEWHGSKDTYKFYGYELLEDGQRVQYGSPDENPDAPADPTSYSSDVYTDKAVELIGRRARAGDPFFLSVAYLAPHGGGPNARRGEPEYRCESSAKPAIRHLGRLAHEPLPQPPSFNEADVSDKPTEVQGSEPLSEERIADITRRYRCRSESLYAIDEGVERIVDALRAAGELDETLLLYTSDNGFFHGEHRIPGGKNEIYEEAIRVPLLIRGPGIEKGIATEDLASNADLAPTILDAAGAEPGRVLDGRSLLPRLRHPARLSGRAIVIEQSNYDAIRTQRYVYAEYDGGNNAGQAELYDLEADPFELENLAADPAHAEVRDALDARLSELAGCSGRDCRAKPDLELDLPAAKRSDGQNCRRAGRFRVTLGGDAADQLTEVGFRVGRKLDDRDDAAPFRERLRPRWLRKQKRPRIVAEAELLDGRAVTLERRVRICD